MRKYMDIINEGLDEAKPVKTKDKTKFDFLKPEVKGGEVTNTKKSNAAPKIVDPMANVASAEKTRSIAASVPADKQAEFGRHMSSLHNFASQFTDPDGDTHTTVGHVQKPVNVENLPAVISSAVSKDGAQPPQWHQVKSLPGYVQYGIRMLGKSVFQQFTKTPLEDIQVLSSITNPENDVKGMMAWIKQNAVRDESVKIDFNQIMPGYEAETSVWSTSGYKFLLVRDFMGVYIYGGADGRGVHITKEPSSKKLR